MEYTNIVKNHAYELLYPLAAKALGLNNLFMRTPNAMTVRYYGNQYCDGSDNADNAMLRLTVECDLGKYGKVYFMPHPVGDSYGYNVYVNDSIVARISPMEWELVRPKVYGDFTEYFMEFGKAIEAYQYLTVDRAAEAGEATHPFIVSHYRRFVHGFRDTMHNKFHTFTAKSLMRPVEILFNSENVYESPVHEHMVVTKTINNKLMLIASSLN